MAGTIPHESIADGSFITMPDGTERCIRVLINVMGSVVGVCYARPSYDPLFTPLGNIMIISSDFAGVKEIGQDGGWWSNPTGQGQPSCAQLEADGSLVYVSPRTGVTYPGIYGCCAYMADWLIQNSNKGCEAATNHWFVTKYLAKMQTASEPIFAAFVPDPPPTPVPQKDYKPDTVGQIVNTLVLGDLVSTRVTLTVDPHDSKRVIVGAAPIP